MTKYAHKVDIWALYKHPDILKALYRAFVCEGGDGGQGTAQMMSEIQRLVDGGRPVGGLQGYAVRGLR